MATKKALKFHRVKTTDYYGLYEDIPRNGVSGIRLKQNQPILVRWPDGKVSKEYLNITLSSKSVQVDMTPYPDTARVRVLSFTLRINGLPVAIPLRKLRVAFPEEV